MVHYQSSLAIASSNIISGSNSIYNFAMNPASTTTLYAIFSVASQIRGLNFMSSTTVFGSSFRDVGTTPFSGSVSASGTRLWVFTRGNTSLYYADVAGGGTTLSTFTAVSLSGFPLALALL